MNNVVKNFALLLITILLFGVFYGQTMIIKNQKIQMKQQFHSDFIALVSLLGEDGLKKIATAKNTDSLTMKESFATALLLQRFVIANKIRSAWTSEEREYLEKDMKATMASSQLLRDRWEQVRRWYSPEERHFLDKVVFDVLSEKEKMELKRDGFTNEKN